MRQLQQEVQAQAESVETRQVRVSDATAIQVRVLQQELHPKGIAEGAFGQALELCG